MRVHCLTDWRKIGHGAKICDIGCADHVAVDSSKPGPLQSLVSTSEEYVSMERYDFQLVKGEPIRK